MGLGSMRERAAEIGWSFSVTSAPGAGTRIVVEQRSSSEEAPRPALAGATSVQQSQVEAAQSDGRVEGWQR